ncbi:nucleotidyl cyclase domain-containing protein [Flavobacterium chungangense]|uniref:adenylate/guanylate cyclase domain-containing protein n=1 Tax=Flavobacterium chungangense TaxID=554283 RepID=UPI0004DFB773|nr:adenylate/guanylate cyclase domain-containing protein [Flavobacterium chungangense]
MANLELIKKLNLKYNKPTAFTRSTKSFSLNESFNGNIQLAIQNNISSLGSNYTTYFEQGKTAEVVLLFIDVCNFSTRFSNLDGNGISQYFDEYYDLVIPIIYEFGGEIDKIIGDGIICVFGQPFLAKNLNDCISIADKCAKKIIVETKKRDKFKSKIAFHFGKINYFKNKSIFYNELTIVGKPLTELFRLESISENEKINYFVNSDYYDNWNDEINQNSLVWTLEKIQSVPLNLKGVDYKYFQTNKYYI